MGDLARGGLVNASTTKAGTNPIGMQEAAPCANANAPDDSDGTRSRVVQRSPGMPEFTGPRGNALRCSTISPLCGWDRRRLAARGASFAGVTRTGSTDQTGITRFRTTFHHPGSPSQALANQGAVHTTSFTRNKSQGPNPVAPQADLLSRKGRRQSDAVVDPCLPVV